MRDVNLLVPTIIENSTRGERAYDLFSRLLHEHIILINGPIEEQMAGLDRGRIALSGQRKLEPRDQHVHKLAGRRDHGRHGDLRYHALPALPGRDLLRGPGGELWHHPLDGGRPGPALRAAPCPRSPAPAAHPGQGVAGQVTDIDIHAREMLHTRDVLNDVIALHTGQPLDRIRHDTERDFFLSAEQAKDYGIVDDVLALEDWKARSALDKPAGPEALGREGRKEVSGLLR